MLDIEVDAVMARREGLLTEYVFLLLSNPSYIDYSSHNVRVCGVISSGAWGQGRSSPDRQFYYINGRPCDLKQVSRAINEVYKSFNTHQSPLAVLDFQIPPESVDINVSPDKRTIFVHSETNLIAALRTALEEFFAPSRSSYAVAGASTTVKVMQHTQTLLDMVGTEAINVTQEDEDEEAEDEKMRDAERHVPSTSRRAGFRSASTRAEASRLQRRQLEEAVEEVEEAEEEDEADKSGQVVAHNFSTTQSSSPVPSPTTLNGRIPSSRRRSPSNESIQFEGEVEISQPPSTTSTSSRRRRKSTPPIPVPRPTQTVIDTTTASWSPDRIRKRAVPIAGVSKSGKEARNSLRTRLAGFASQGAVSMQAGSDESMEDEAKEGEEAEEVEEIADTDVDDELEEADPRIEVGGDAEEGPDDMDELMSEEEDVAVAERASETLPHHVGERIDETEALATSTTTPTPSRTTLSRTDGRELSAARTNGASTSALAREASGYRDEITSTNIQGELTLRFNLDRVRSRYKASSAAAAAAPASAKSSRDVYSTMAEGSINAAAGIANRDSVRAEQALSRVISKADFDRMQVLGQFNKGFIIARLTTDEMVALKGEKKATMGSDDLFIIDQHASDEKYNFETLQRTTVIKAQSLIKWVPDQMKHGI